jgi:prolyl 4-hydroxylase
MLIWFILSLIAVTILFVIILILAQTSSVAVTTKAIPSDSTLIDPRIDLHYIPNFLSDEEADHLIRLAEGHFNRSGVIGPNGEDNYIDTNRTSSTYFVPESIDPMIEGIERRASQTLGIDRNQLEGLQVVKYEPGQYFNQHHDWFTPDYAKKVGAQREFTIFAYLTTSDGATEFPKLGRSFQPKKGDALKWRNCSTPDRCEDLNLHRGAPPRAGVKYGLNIWSRF